MYEFIIKRPFHKTDVCVKTKIKELYDVLNEVYTPLNRIDIEKNDNDRDGKETNPTGIINIDFMNNKPDYTELQEIENLLYSSTEIEDGFLAIHSAVVVKNKKAFLLTGRTEAGKSTLTAYLCKNGFEYYSDDIAIINKNDLSVYAYPRPIQLRKGGVEVLKKYGIDLKGSTDASYGDIQRTNLTLPKCDEEKAELAGIYFIERTKEESSMVKMSKSESFAEIMSNMYVFVQPNGEIIRLINRICDLPVFTLKYEDMEFVKQCLTEA